MIDALNTRAGMVVAGGVTCFVLGVGVWVWLMFSWLLSWIVVFWVIGGTVALFGWIYVELSRRIHAPRVVFDKGEKLARVVDGQVLPRSPYPAGLTSLSLRNDHYPPLLEEPTVVDELAQLPGSTDLLSTLHSFQPSPERVLLALGPAGPLTCSVKELSHVALTAPTGGGKSSIVRLLLAQLLAIGVPVTLCDPHYTDFDVESGEDWRPIRMHLARPPLIDPYEIVLYLGALVEEMHRRYDVRRAGQSSGQIEVSVIEELPEVLARLSKDERQQVVADYSELLRSARKVGLYLIVVAQDFLVDTIGSGGGEIRANLRTAYFAGGGLSTARALLDPQFQPSDAPLGKGVVYLRNDTSVPTPALVRVPYASNDALYRLLLTGRVDLEDVPPLAPLPMKTVAPSSSFSPPLSPTGVRPTVRLSAEERERQRVLDMHQKHPDAKPYELCGLLGISNNKWRKIEQIIVEAEEESADNVVPLHTGTTPGGN